METIRTNFPSQYYSPNTKAITFENDTHNKPKNIYEIISAEKITPKEIDMTKEGLKLFKTTTKISNEGVMKDDETKKSIETDQIEESLVDDGAQENFDEKGNMTILDEDSDLSVSELEKSDDKVKLDY